MRYGCLAAGDVKCGECGKIIRHPERYFVTDEEEITEPTQKKLKRYCVECAILKGYAHYRSEKGKSILTFLP